MYSSKSIFFVFSIVEYKHYQQQGIGKIKFSFGMESKALGGEWDMKYA